ncbi:ly6/PLAUR domain-containing protein 2-like [Dromiciops gliroides]|uniref:ly6/PLAUR domain-containing protein 2-like n=1 Tax=Dromiciops gliroides TaxID=33562 RepID=UPI001CC58A9D|nr:ly6/PLAUR domain-containing protein 2-like [Dromiciops gliroides]
MATSPEHFRRNSQSFKEESRPAHTPLVYYLPGLAGLRAGESLPPAPRSLRVPLLESLPCHPAGFPAARPQTRIPPQPLRACLYTMPRPVLAVFLLAVAALPLGGSLRCFSCPKATALSLCIDVANCSAAEGWCQTILLSVQSGYPFMQNKTVQRGCVASCVPTDPDAIGESQPILCCNTDLCVDNGALVPQGSGLILTVFLCALLSAG